MKRFTSRRGSLSGSTLPFRFLFFFIFSSEVEDGVLSRKEQSFIFGECCSCTIFVWERTTGLDGAHCFRVNTLDF
jgi:hypothetical protein